MLIPFMTGVLIGIIILVTLLLFGIVITAFVKAWKHNKEATAWMRSESDARRAWGAAGARATGRPGTGRAQFRAPKTSAPEESLFTRMRKVLFK